MASPSVRTRRFTRLEYERLVADGFFGGDERLELLDGALVVREPQGPPHVTAIRATEEALRRACGDGWEIRTQAPIALDDDSEPEPDVAVVPGSYRDYRRHHPSRPVLVVEVAETTLGADRRKATIYARARVLEYWLLNLEDGLLEVHREPRAPEPTPSGTGYAVTERLGRGDVVAPVTVPTARIPVADLLP